MYNYILVLIANQSRCLFLSGNNFYRSQA